MPPAPWLDPQLGLHLPPFPPVLKQMTNPLLTRHSLGNRSRPRSPKPSHRLPRLLHQRLKRRVGVPPQL